MAGHTLRNDPWADYALNETPPWWSFQEMDRSTARAEYREAMLVKFDRIEELKKLVARFGLQLDNSNESIQVLNDWFVGVMTPLPERSIPDGRSLSVCEDVALLLGDLMILRHPELRWDFFVWGKKNVSFQSPVIMGFSLEDPKWHSNLALNRLIYSYGVNVLQHRLSASEDVSVQVGQKVSPEELDWPPLDRSEFVTILRRVDQRCGLT